MKVRIWYNAESKEFYPQYRECFSWKHFTQIVSWAEGTEVRIEKFDTYQESIRFLQKKKEEMVDLLLKEARKSRSHAVYQGEL